MPGGRLWAVVMADPRQEWAAVSMMEKVSIATSYPAPGVRKILPFGHVPAEVEPVRFDEIRTM